MRIKSFESPATEEKLTAFESRYGIDLPESYRSFLKRSNGGLPKPSTYYGVDGTLHNVAQFLSITGGDIERELVYFPRCIEHGLLPIAISGGNQWYFISLSTGSILAWPEGTGSAELPRDGEMPVLAADLDEFFRGFVGEEQPEDQILKIGESGEVALLDEFLRGRDLDARNGAGRTVAMEAARHGQLKLLKRCVELGASTQGLLHCAAISCKREVIDFALGLGLDINQRDAGGRTPLSWATFDDAARTYLKSLGAVESPQEHQE